MTETDQSQSIRKKFGKPKDAIAYANVLRRDDEEAAQARAMAKGMVDGNPPYVQKLLDEDNQSDRTNVNFRESEAHLAKGVTSFYDALTEAPLLVECTTDFGGQERSQEYSRIISEEGHAMLSDAAGQDGRMQTSQYNMVLYGIGPMFYVDKSCVLPKVVRPGNLLVPKDAPADVSDWPACVIFSQENVDDLEDMISDEKKADAVGWKPAMVKKSIMRAGSALDLPNTWEAHQQKIRNNQLGSSQEYGKVDLAHIFYREKSGKITHLVVDMNLDDDYIYESHEEYDNWKQCVWAGYYDRGDGTHHSVKGMGVKMFSTMDLKNKHLCHAMDCAFDQMRTYLVANGEDAVESFAVVQKGPFSILPPGTEVQTRNIAGNMEVPMVANRLMDGVLTNNLSQYNETLNKPQGNPRTAFEVGAILSQQQTISKTQITRYYEQLDDLRSEQMRRAIKGQDEIGKAFLKRLDARKVPREALQNIKVKAGRVAGQGSAFLRSQTLQQVLQLAASLPESGRINLIRDWIASLLGQNMVERYFPMRPTQKSDQREFQLATLELGALKDAIIVPVSDEDNHTIHLGVHFKAATDAFESLVSKRTRDPYENADFIMSIMQHIQMHLQMMSTNPMQAQGLQMGVQQFEGLKAMAQEAPKMAQQLDEERKSAQAGGIDPEQARKEAEHMNAERRKDEALAADIERKNQKQSQMLALKDAQVAEGIRRTRQQDAAKMEMTVAKAAVDTEIKKEKAKAEPKKKQADKK